MFIPYDIWRLIAVKLSYTDLEAYSSVIPINLDTVFWIDKAEYDMGVDREYISHNCGDYHGRELYLAIASYNYVPLPGVEKYVKFSRDKCQLIWKFAQKGDLISASHILQGIPDPEFNNLCLLLMTIGGVLSGKTIPDDSTVLGKMSYFIAEQMRPEFAKIYPNFDRLNDQSVIHYAKEVVKIIDTNNYSVTNPINYCPHFREIIQLTIIFKDIRLIKFLESLEDNIQSIGLGILTIMYDLFTAGITLGDKYVADLLKRLVELNLYNIDLNSAKLVVDHGNIYMVDLIIDHLRPLLTSEQLIEIIKKGIDMASNQQDVRMIKILSSLL